MLRRQRLHRSSVSSACGSAEYRIDGTIVVAAVHGPLRIAPWREAHDRGVIDVELSAPGWMSRDDQRACEGRLRGAIERCVELRDFPRFGLRVSARVVSDDGNAEAACVNAMCCALIDANVPMRGLICANACALTREGSMVIDPTKREETEARAVVRACALSKHREKDEIAIVGCSTTGALTEKEYLDAIAFIVDATAAVVNIQKKSIARYEVHGKLHEDEAPKKRQNTEDAPMEGMENRPLG